MQSKQNHSTPEDNGNTKINKKFELDRAAREKIESEFSDVEYYRHYPKRRNNRPASRKRIIPLYNSDYGADDDDYEEPQKPKKHRLRRIITAVIILCILVIIINVIILLFTGRIWFNEPRKRDYPIRGPVISEEMGEINWSKFASQNIQLGFIRATKSSTYIDKSFETNWAESAETDLPVGALHIFDPDIDGKEQAEHFHSTVGDLSGRIVPAVEVKLTGFRKIIPPDYDKLTERLVDFTERLEEIYGAAPIICCDKRIYKNVICNKKQVTRKNKTNFEGCPIWYESLYSKPDEDVKWDFWCYTNKTKYSFYESKDYLKVVLFKSSEEEFKKYLIE